MDAAFKSLIDYDCILRNVYVSMCESGVTNDKLAVITGDPRFEQAKLAALFMIRPDNFLNFMNVPHLLMLIPSTITFVLPSKNIMWDGEKYYLDTLSKPEVVDEIKKELYIA